MDNTRILDSIIYHLLTRKAFKFPIINNIQKILLMVFFMSFTLFIITSYIYASKPLWGGEFNFWQYEINSDTIYTNWIGMIALANTVASLAGFFLFKDEK